MNHYQPPRKLYFCITHVILSLALLAATMVHAQQMPPASQNPIVGKCVDSARKVLAQMRPELEKYANLPPIEDLVLFVPKADYSANALFKFKRIEISYAMCYEMLFNADAAAVVREAFPDQLSKLTAYSKEVSKQTVLAEKTSEPGNIKQPSIKRFLDWVGIGKVSVPMYISDNIECRNNEIIHDEFALLFGHEVAHLIENDQAGPTIPRGTARMQEARADKKGYDLASKVFFVDGSPFALFPMFGLLNRRHSLIPGDLDTHPLVECRVAYFFKRTNFMNRLAQVEIGPADKAYLDATLADAKKKTGVTATTLAEIFENVLKQPECQVYQ